MDLPGSVTFFLRIIKAGRMMGAIGILSGFFLSELHDIRIKVEEK